MNNLYLQLATVDAEDGFNTIEVQIDDEDGDTETGRDAGADVTNAGMFKLNEMIILELTILL